MGNIKEDIRMNEFIQKTSATYIYAEDENGKQMKIPASLFLKTKAKGVPYIDALGHHQLIRLSYTSYWERFAVLIIIADSAGVYNCNITITGTLSSGGPVYYKVNAIGSVPDFIKLLYKKENSMLSIYVYSSIEQDSLSPFLAISTESIELIGTTDDISGYDEMAISSYL